MIAARLAANAAALDALQRRIDSRYPRAKRDQWGMLPSDHEEITASIREEDRRQRRAALAALWGPPVLDYVRYDGVSIFKRSRDEEWTFWRAIQATVGLVLGRYWNDEAAARWERRSTLAHALFGRPNPYRFRLPGLTLVYWDNRRVYGGYSVEVLQLYPGCRIEHFNDGETSL